MCGRNWDFWLNMVFQLLKTTAARFGVFSNSFAELVSKQFSSVEFWWCKCHWLKSGLMHLLLSTFCFEQTIFLWSIDHSALRSKKIISLPKIGLVLGHSTRLIRRATTRLGICGWWLINSEESIDLCIASHCLPLQFVSLVNISFAN